MTAKPDTTVLVQAKSTTTTPNSATLVTTVMVATQRQHQVQRSAQSASFAPSALSTRRRVPQAKNVPPVATTTWPTVSLAPSAKLTMIDTRKMLVQLATSVTEALIQ